VTARPSRSVVDGTGGGTARGGRRTHIIQLLRDSKEPLSAADVADKVGIHVNTARFHLEALVDVGLATRETEARGEPGRRRVMYVGTLPNQTHERAQGYRLLSQFLMANIASRHPDLSPEMYEVGEHWGHYLTARPDPFEVFSGEEVDQRLVDKLDALWFAPELRHDPEPHLVLHNCPFIESATSAPFVVCQLHGGMLNGSLEELRSNHRVVQLCLQVQPHTCLAKLGPVPAEVMKHVSIKLPNDPD